MSSVPLLPSADAAPAHGSTRRWSTAAVVVAALPVLIAGFGALAARPIADDYSSEAEQALVGTRHGFSFWMRSGRTPLYSMFTWLAGGARLERAIGMKVYYPLASIVIVLLFVLAALVIIRSWTAITGLRLPVALGTLLLAAGFLGALASLSRPTEPDLFGALYWESAWVPHVVPILLLPLVLAGVVKATGTESRLRSAAVPLALIAGLVIAGFGIAEAGISFVAAAATAWAIRQLHGSAAARRSWPALAALGAGLVAGVVIVLALPGTSVRAGQDAALHFGLLSYSGPGAALRTFISDLLHDAVHMVLTPAIPVGVIIGYWLRRTAPAPASDDRERAVIRVVGTAMLATAIGTWVVIAFGDLGSYRAWWHLLPGELVIAVTAAAGGWAVASDAFLPNTAVKARTALRRFATPLLAAVVLWCVASTAVAASAVWARRSVVDRDVAAAKAVAAHRSPSPVVWEAEPVGDPQKDIRDLFTDPTDWSNVAVANWFHLSPNAFRVIPKSAPRATVLP